MRGRRAASAGGCDAWALRRPAARLRLQATVRILARGRLQLTAGGSGAAWWCSAGRPRELRQGAQVARAREQSGASAKREQAMRAGRVRQRGSSGAARAEVEASDVGAQM
jgi:hypothetical protein